MSATVVELGQLVEIVRGITFPSSAKRREIGAGLIPCLRTSNVQDEVEWDDLIYVSKEHVGNDEQRIRQGDILVSMSNSLDLVGKCALVTHVPTPATFGAFVAVVRPKGGIDSRYIFRAMRSPAFRAHIRSVASTTTNISNINSSKLLAATIPIFGSATRERIVSKVDELFSEIDEGERALGRAQKLIERYRQSALKDAVTGEVTHEWREKRKGQLESGDALLARILKARREAWERAELDKMKVRGVAPATDKWKKRYEEPAEADASDLPALPNGWVWASLDALADVVGGITVDQKRSTDDCESVPYLRVANVQRGYLDLSEVKPINAPRARIAQLRLQHGDILFNEGGDIDKLGRGWIWEEQLPNCIHQNHVFRARLYLPGSLNKIISWYGNVLGRKLFMQLGKQTTNLASLSLSKLKRFPVPLMSPAEADEIVSRVEDVLSIVDKEHEELGVQGSASSSLRQGVLKAVFAGALVSEVPGDESGSALLQRVANSGTDDPSRQLARRKAAP